MAASAESPADPSPASRAGSRTASRTWRLGRAALLAIVSLLAMEAALDLAALVAGDRLERGRDDAVLLASADVAVYGDSTPYGYHAGTSFPAELARSTGLRVVNRSRPALNSTQVADLMERELRDGSPPVLVVMAGVNDAWNLADVDPDLLGPLGAWRRWLPEPRLLRLLRIWTKAGSADEAVFGPKPRRGDWSRREETGRVLGREGVARITRRSIDRILALARRHGAEVVFVGYQAPGWNGSADAVGEILAADQPDRFVETRSAFAGRDAELIQEDAFHPNDEGQRLIAARLRDALGRRGLLDRVRPPVLPPASPRAGDASADRSAIACTGAPGRGSASPGRGRPGAGRGAVGLRRGNRPRSRLTCRLRHRSLARNRLRECLARRTQGAST